MTYFSLPLSFMHPSSIVMHPPKSLAMSGLSLYEAGAPAGFGESTGQRVESAASYVVTHASGRKSMLDKMAFYAHPVATVLYMDSGFNTPGKIRFSLAEAGGSVVLEQEAWLADGAGHHSIEMSSLKPGRYHLLVAWMDAEEECAVMYQIEKLL